MAKTLTVYLAADLRNFNRGMNQAETRAKGLSGAMSGMLGPALIGAAAAAGALATKLAVDGVQAAIEDEASVTKLTKALENLGMAHDTAPIEAYIDSLEQAYGIADTDLRNAYVQLARTTGDVEEANKALALALDVAAGSSKSLDSVVTALGKAYSGSTGSLAKLNTGLDAATIKTGDMAAITQRLGDLFGGSAQAQAQTFQGQLDRLKTAGENLTEAFGRGVLGAFEDTESQTSDLVTTMAELEPLLESLGKELGNTAGYVTDVIGPLVKLNELFQETSESTGFLSIVMGGLKKTVYNTVNVWKPLAEVVNAATGATKRSTMVFDDMETTLTAVGGGTLGLLGTIEDLTPVIDDNANSALRAAGSYYEYYKSLAAAAQMASDFAGTSGTVATAIKEGLLGDPVTGVIEFTGPDKRFTSEIENVTRGYGRQGQAAEEATQKNKKLTEAYREQSKALESTREDLANAITELDAASAKWQDYYDTIADGLAKGLDLTAAYESQFNREGEKTGVSLLEGFNRQVAHVEWFGNVLKAMQAQGADPAFIQEVAKLGPGIGGALGEQMVTEGVVKTLSEKWVGVQSTIDTLAAGLVPTFLTQGVESATQLVNGLSETLGRQGKRLTNLGREIGKPVGAGFRAQIATDVLEAVRAVEAAATAARAERVAQAQATAANVTEQAVAQAIANLVIKNDARQGVAPGVPTSGMGVVFR